MPPIKKGDNKIMSAWNLIWAVVDTPFPTPTCGLNPKELEGNAPVIAKFSVIIVPEEALYKASQILIQHFQIIGGKEPEVSAEKPKEKKKKKSK